VKTFVMLIATTLLATFPAAAQTPKPQSVAEPAPDVHQAPTRETYRLDYTITELEDGKKVNSRTYSVMCEDQGSGTRGSLKVGSRIPVVSGSSDVPGGTRAVAAQFTYLDVGMNVESRLSITSDNSLSLQSDVEMSSVADNPPAPGQPNAPVIRQLRVTTNNAITPGKPIVISTADDVASHRQFQIQVVATKLK